MMAIGAGALLCLRRWSLGGLPGKLLSVPILILLGLSAFVANTNLLEEMLPPLEAVGYIPAAEVDFIDNDDELLRVETGGGSRAYPLRLLQFHHVVNTSVGDSPALISWCSVKKSAAVYRADLEPGKPLTFRVAGFGNGNLLLEDQQTHSWWEQSTGEAILGPLVGRKLQRLPFETTTLGAAAPTLEVLRPSSESVLVPKGN